MSRRPQNTGWMQPRTELVNQYDLGSDIISSEVDPTTKTIYLNLGDNKGEYTDTVKALYITPFGYMSRPEIPTPKQPSAQAYRQFTGDECIVTGGWDKRCQAVYETLDYGETCVFSCASAARIFCLKDGTISLRTNTSVVSGAPTGNLTKIDVNPDGSIVTTNGTSTVTQSTSQIKLEIGMASITLNADGTIQIQGTIVDVAGQVLTRLGSGGASLVPAVNSALIGPTGIAGQPSATVLITP